MTEAQEQKALFDWAMLCLVEQLKAENQRLKDSNKALLDELDDSNKLMLNVARKLESGISTHNCQKKLTLWNGLTGWGEQLDVVFCSPEDIPADAMLLYRA